MGVLRTDRERGEACILRVLPHARTIPGVVPVAILTLKKGGEETLVRTERVYPSGPTLKDLAQEEVEAGRTRLILDFSFVDQIDSSGVGEMVACYTVCDDIGGECVFAHLQPQVQNILRVTDLDTVLRSFESIEEALGYLAESPDSTAYSTPEPQSHYLSITPHLRP